MRMPSRNYPGKAYLDSDKISHHPPGELPCISTQTGRVVGITEETVVSVGSSRSPRERSQKYYCRNACTSNGAAFTAERRLVMHPAQRGETTAESETRGETAIVEHLVRIRSLRTVRCAMLQFRRAIIIIALCRLAGRRREAELIRPLV